MTPRIAILAAVAATGLFGCAKAPNPVLTHPTITIHGNALAQIQILARGLDDEPRSLDPQLASDIPAQKVSDDLFEGLTTIDMAGRAVPGVADSWSHSVDGLVWTFHLRPEARWSNGQPVTPQDFVFAWRREVDPKTGAPYADSLAPIENARDIAGGKKPPETLGVAALDEHTLEVRLTGPTPYLLDLLAQQPLLPVYGPAIAQFGERWTSPDHFVGDGAFILKEHVIGDRMTLEKNPAFRDAASVRLSRVIYYVLADKNIQTTRYLAGDVQWTDSFAASSREWLKSTLGDQVVNAPYLGTYMLGFGFAVPPFANNPSLRKALVLAIDREPMVIGLKHGMYEPAYTLVPPLPGYEPPRPDWQALSDEQRHALARKYYREAGYSEEHPAHFEINVSQQGPDDRHFWEAVIASWRSVLGANVGLDEREFKVLMQERSLHKLPLFLDAWLGDYPDPNTFLQIFYSGDGNNNGAYSNTNFDRLVDRAAHEAVAQNRYRLFEQAERILNDDAAYIPLFHYATRHLIKPYLRGWQSNVIDRNPSRYMYLLDHVER